MLSTPLAPFQMIPEFHPKVWGARELSPWFPDVSEKIGEVWFTAHQNRSEAGPTLEELMREQGVALLGEELARRCPNRFPLLVKFLFTSEPLSVQVHPDDAYAARTANSPGKTEMWHVLRGRPGAEVALGFGEEITRERLRAAAMSGEIEQLLSWQPAGAGDTFFVPAGTVHAIGGGLAICEIQQNSDITYRLWDYGRPREVHLEDAFAVAHLGPGPAPVRPSRLAPARRLMMECEYFRTEQLAIDHPYSYPPDAGRFHLLIVLSGEGRLDGRAFRCGQVWVVPPRDAAFPILPGTPAVVLDVSVP